MGYFAVLFICLGICTAVLCNPRTINSGNDGSNIVKMMALRGFYRKLSISPALGQIFHAKVQISDNAQFLGVSLCDQLDDSINKNCPFQVKLVNPNILIMNTMINSIWGFDEIYPNVQFTSGGYVDIQFYLSSNSYHVAINNNHRFNYYRRGDPYNARYLNVNGDVEKVLLLNQHVVYPISDESNKFNIN